MIPRQFVSAVAISLLCTAASTASAQEPTPPPPPTPSAPPIPPAPPSVSERAAALERARCGAEVDESILAPILSGEAVEGVEPVYAFAGGKGGAQKRLIGASLKVKPQANVSAEGLDRALECYAAKRVLGRPTTLPSVAHDPFAIPNRLVGIEVASAKDGYRIAIVTETPEEAQEMGAQEILTRSNALIEVPAATAKKEAEQKPAEPFAFADFTWLNGNSRQHKAVLDTPYFTPEILLDVNYTASTNNPIDNTVVGSTALSRNNEFTLAFLGFGGDFHYDAARARIMTQFGVRSTLVPRNDVSTNRGQFDLQTALRYVSEAYGGIHLDYMHGINIDAGIFMSYVGLFSYDNFENWAYLPSFTSDNTPWFFNGVRIQMFPTDKLKIEPWIINGWQTYGKFNEMPGFGAQILYRPTEWLSVLSNDYVGWDTQNNPGRMRFHTDNSVQVRWLENKESVLNRAAFSITADLGGEQGDGVTPFGGSGTESGPDGKTSGCSVAHPCTQNFMSWMAYHRMWFWGGHFAWNVGGGMMHNPGRYLVLAPTGNATPTSFLQPLNVPPATQPFDTNAGTNFDAFDYMTGIQWMPNEQITYDLELNHRESAENYFAGHGGVTSPDGYSTTPSPSGWRPDLVKSDTRVILAMLVRF